MAPHGGDGHAVSTVAETGPPWRAPMHARPLQLLTSAERGVLSPTLRASSSREALVDVRMSHRQSTMPRSNAGCRWRYARPTWPLSGSARRGRGQAVDPRASGLLAGSGIALLLDVSRRPHSARELPAPW